MEVCYVINDLAPAGAQTAVHDLVGRVVDRDVVVTVCYFEGDTPMADSLADTGAEVIGLRSRGKFDVQAVSRLLGILQRTEFDLVHAHLPYSQVIARLLASVVGDLPVVSTQHGFPDSYHPLTRRLEQWTRWLDNITIANSTAVQSAFDRGSDRVDWRVIYNGVDVERFADAIDSYEADAIRRRLRFDDGPLLLSVGRYESIKGHTTLIDAMADVVPAHPSATLVVVGWGPLRDDLKRRAIDRGVEDHVVLTGRVPTTEMPAYYAAGDAFVLASRSEAFGLSAVEAMAAGLPVVAPDIPGVREVVGTDGHGVLVPPDVSDAFADAILAVLADHDGQPCGWAQERANRFAIKRTVDEHLSLYRELVA